MNFILDISLLVSGEIGITWTKCGISFDWWKEKKTSSSSPFNSDYLVHQLIKKTAFAFQ